MKYHRQAHVVYHTQYHIVWIPRYRRKILKQGVAVFLYDLLLKTRRWYPELRIMECSIQPDHVHLLITVPPKMSVSTAVRIFKTNTSRALKKSFPFLRKLYPYKQGIWSVGFFVSTVGVNQSIIKKYIQMQEMEDRGQAELA